MYFQKRTAIVFLSVIIPMSLFLSLRMTGVSPGPPTVSLTTKLNLASWTTERPDGDCAILENVTASYKSDITLTPSIFVVGYEPSVLAADQGAVLFFVNVTGTLSLGFVYSVNITLSENYNNSAVWFWGVADWPAGYASQVKNLSIFSFASHVKNLSIFSYAHLLQGSGLKAFITLASTGEPKNVYFDGAIYWFLDSPYSQTHSMEVDMDVIYYNGTTYKKVIQPFLLKIGPDNNNDFQHATEIHQGNNTGLYLGFADTVDYYKIQLEQGQTNKIRVYPTSNCEPIINVFVYNPEEKLVAENAMFDYSKTLEFVSDETGYWYIEIQNTYNFGFYTLEVS
jgi:hypothetical protein